MRYVTEKYGRESVAQIIAFARLHRTFPVGRSFDTNEYSRHVNEEDKAP